LKTISIAGIKIRLQSKENIDIGFDAGYIPYMISDECSDHEIVIEVRRGLEQPNEFLGKLLFEASDEERNYFRIYCHNDTYAFYIYDPIVKNRIQQIALLNRELNEWVIYCEANDSSNTVFPLMYPMGPLVFYYLTVKFEMIMIHASGVFDGNCGNLFTGFSGSGKSTMASIWGQEGSEIINDDRIIVRQENGNYFMYNTPMFYTDSIKKSRVDNLFIIHHSRENALNQVYGVMAVSGVLAFCIQHAYNPLFVSRHLAFVHELCSKIPIFDLGFFPDKNVIHFIKSHEI
jgi:hypothetical protein